MSQLLKDFIKSEIHPMMKELGYRKKANYFWRKNDVFVLPSIFSRVSGTSREGMNFLLIVVSIPLKSQRLMEKKQISQSFL